MTTPDLHYVYRCYDADDRLLYIGCTNDVVARLQVHASDHRSRASYELTRRMARYEFEEFPSRTSGYHAERLAIRAEAPLLNTLHNQGRGFGDVPLIPSTSPEFAARMADVLAHIGVDR